MISLGLVSNFFGKTWKFWAVGVAAAAIFFAGAQWAGKRYQQKLAEIERATAAAIVQREAELREEHRAALRRGEDMRRRLASDLEALRASESELLSRLESAELVKPLDEIVVERIVNTGERCEVVANPFGADFVVLWNDASRRPAD